LTDRYKNGDTEAVEGLLHAGISILQAGCSGISLLNAYITTIAGLNHAAEQTQDRVTRVGLTSLIVIANP
jgi:hypothetical protein